MKILSLSLDNSVLDITSSLARRVIEYSSLIKRYTVIVPSCKNDKIELSEKVMIYGSGGNNKLMQFIKVYNLAKKILRDERCDVITVQDQYYLALIGLRLAKKYQLGLEIQVHGFEKYSGLRRLIAKYVLPRANIARVVSQRLKKQLIDDFKVAEDKIVVVPIHSEINILKRDKITGRNKFVFLTVGRLVPVKNIGLQIEAMAEILKKYPQTELWIVGKGSEFNNLKLKISRLDETTAKQENLKLDGNIKLFGQKSREELSFIYGEADAFILSSNSEGWGLVVIEAAAQGLPIIMTDVGCAGEIIKDGESGIIIPIGDREKLIAAMIKIIEDGELRKKLGRAAVEEVKKLPSREATPRLYLESWKKAAR